MLVRDSGPNESTIGIQTAPASANVAAHFFMPMPYLARRCNPAKGVGERYRDFSPTNTQCVFKEGDTITAMDSPKCKLINPPTDARCDCGYDFTTGNCGAILLDGTRPPRFETCNYGRCCVGPSSGSAWIRTWKSGRSRRGLACCLRTRSAGSCSCALSLALSRRSLTVSDIIRSPVSARPDPTKP